MSPPDPSSPGPGMSGAAITLFERVGECLWEDNQRSVDAEEPFGSMLREYRAMGGDLDFTPDDGGRSLLVRACDYQNALAIRLLIEQGADPNLRDRDGVSPLLMAIDSVVDCATQNGHEVNWGPVKLLLEKGADANLEPEDGSGFRRFMLLHYGPDLAGELIQWLQHCHRCGRLVAPGALGECRVCGTAEFLEKMPEDLPEHWEGAQERRTLLRSGASFPPLCAFCGEIASNDKLLSWRQAKPAATVKRPGWLGRWFSSLPGNRGQKITLRLPHCAACRGKQLLLARMEWDHKRVVAYCHPRFAEAVAAMPG